MKYAGFIVSGLIIAVVSSTYAFSSKSPEQIIAESIRKSNMEINIRNSATLEKYQENIRDCTKSQTGSSREVLQKLSTCLDRPKPKLEDLISTDGDSDSVKIDNAKVSLLPTPTDKNPDALRLSICKKIPTSPLCNQENFAMARAIAYKKALIWRIADREHFFRVGVGIMNSESTLGINYAGTCDSSYNNFGGIKWRILDTGEAVKDQPIPQGKDNKCWLYKFNSQEDYFGSKYNSLGKGYGKCFDKKDPVHCISFAYVGDRNVAERSWINNVNSFAK